MGRADAAIRGLTLCAGCVLALLVGGAGARAADVVFTDIVWPRHDKATGFLDWELRAATARSLPKSRYACERLELCTFQVVEQQGVKRSEKEMRLWADEGTYDHGMKESVAVLKGRVTAELYAGNRLRVETVRKGEAERPVEVVVNSTWDEDKQVRTRTVETASKVRIRRWDAARQAADPDRELTGEHMRIVEQRGAGKEGGAPDHSLLELRRDILMKLRGRQDAQPFPALGKPKPGAPETRVSCLGPLVYDRRSGRAVFRNRAAVQRGGDSLHCEKLTLGFHDAPDAKTGLRSLLAEQNVVIQVKDNDQAQTLRGDRFEWDPDASVGKLSGAPARMTTPDMVARAKQIEFDQKKQTLRAERDVVIEVKDADQARTLRGDRFEWDPNASVGKLSGAPARMTAPDMVARAKRIEFDQKKQLITCEGDAELDVTLRAR